MYTVCRCRIDECDADDDKLNNAISLSISFVYAWRWRVCL